MPIVFECFIAGLPLRAIARELDAAGVPTRRGGSWSPSSIRSQDSVPGRLLRS
ncbi:recombinase family protein [Curtobacterium sp. 22159]|uniref:recombinase family protein n=1 Tax=Curtobacterium sp. 22159 TaxID=3453882 RepID=UPI003F86BD4F